MNNIIIGGFFSHILANDQNPLLLLNNFHSHYTRQCKQSWYVDYWWQDHGRVDRIKGTLMGYYTQSWLWYSNYLSHWNLTAIWNGNRRHQLIQDLSRSDLSSGHGAFLSSGDPVDGCGWSAPNRLHSGDTVMTTKLANRSQMTHPMSIRGRSSFTG